MVDVVVDLDGDDDVDLYAAAFFTQPIAISYRYEGMLSFQRLDVLKLRRLIASPCYDDGIRLLQAVVAMVTKMI